MKNGARIVVLLFAVVAIVAILVVWKKQSRTQARQTLLENYGAEISVMAEETTIGCASEKLTDLVAFAELLERAGESPAILDLTGAPNLASFRGVERIPSLTSLVAIACPKLVSADGVAGHSSLLEIVLTDSANFADASAIRNLPSLVTLDFSGCETLETVDISDLPALQNLYLSRCREVGALDVGSFTRLRQLYLDGCGGLTTLTGLENLGELTDLDISNATALQRVPGVAGLAQLIVLDIRNVAIEDFSGIGSLPSLRILRMGGQDSIETLEPFAKLSTLREIHLEACPNFRSVEGIPPSVSQYAGFTYCPSLVSIEGIEAAPGIESLDLTGCENLENIAAVSELDALLHLSLMKCRQVTDVSAIAGLEKLMVVMLGGSGVVPASVEELDPANDEMYFDFSLAE